MRKEYVINFPERNKTKMLPYSWLTSIMKKVDVYQERNERAIKKSVDKDELNDIID